MNSEICGIFGSQGLLSKLEAEEEHDQSPKHRRDDENTGGQSSSDSTKIVPERGESVEKIDQCTEGSQDLRFTSEENNLPTAVLRLKDLPPLEAVFSTQEIFEKIFSFLDTVDLLQCRLVSCWWLQLVTNNKLLRRNRNAILISHYHGQHGDITVRVKGRSRPLKDLTDVLDSLGSNTFPSTICASLHITTAHDDFLKCFDSFGFAVNNLYIAFQTQENDEDFVYEMDSLLGFMTKLLTEQMPNLETLSIFFEENAQFTGVIDPQILNSIQKGLYCAGRQNQILRKIKCFKQTPFEIIDAVCCLAPKLNDLVVHDWGFWAKTKHRAYLLTTLEFAPIPDNWGTVDSIEAVVNSVEKMNVKNVTVQFYFVRNNPELWPGLAGIVTRIFKKSFESLEELHLYPSYFLPGTVLPQMPEVKLLSLDSYHKQPEWSFFPQGISLATTFPTLHTIKCKGEASIMRILPLFKDDKIASVKSIMSSSRDDNRTELRKYFPNAVIC